MSSSPPEPRPPRDDEAEAVAELLNEHAERVAGAKVSAAEVRRWWETEVDRESRVRIVPGFGYADLSDFAGRWWADVRSSDRAAFAALLDWTETAAGRPLRCHCDSADTEAAAMLEARGYAVIRSSYRMAIELGDEPPPDADWPDGIEVRTMREGEEHAVYEAEQESFADHWEFTPRSFDEWQRRRLHPAGFARELWFLATAGDEIAGVALCGHDPSGDPSGGWVNELGVRRPWRRRGIALALLRHAFRELHAVGKRRVTLGVDAENTTGAVVLYEQAGMRQIRRFDTYELAS
jgi:ribosomal protein S18 acetylase RimI-like enzyme